MEPFATLDWLIIDHYSIDERWEKILRPLCKRLLAIDDLYNRKHDVDVLLNQNFPDINVKEYQHLLPEHCWQLLGPRFALLQDEYQIARNFIKRKNKKIKNIFIYFGGVDTSNLTCRSLKALMSIQNKNFTVDVVAPCVGPHRSEIIALSTQLSWVTLHDRTPSLARLMSKADLALGAGGATSWERLCLGIKSIVITLSKNQIGIAKSLHEKNLVWWLGHHEEVTEKEIQGAVEKIINKEISIQLADICKNTVDGCGTNRIYNFLHAYEDQALRVRPIKSQDMVILNDWCIQKEELVKSLNLNADFKSSHGYEIFIVESTTNEIVGVVLCDYKRKDKKLQEILSPFVGKFFNKVDLREAVVAELISKNDKVNV